MRAEDFNLSEGVVGAWRFELQTSCAQGRRATRLRYAPTNRVAILPYFENSLLLWSGSRPRDCGRNGKSGNLSRQAVGEKFRKPANIVHHLTGLNRQLRGFPSCDAAGNFTDGIKSIALQQTRGNG
jgi:hypothetical protein